MLFVSIHTVRDRCLKDLLVYAQPLTKECTKQERQSRKRGKVIWLPNAEENSEYIEF
jgi:hypothetical protein